MSQKPEAHPDSVNGRLVDFLTSQKEVIMTEWQDRVRSDRAILLTETLNTRALKNRLPDILDDLISTLRSYGSETVAEQTAKDAVQHGATRLKQGYELSEMLYELKHLRSVLIYHMTAFEDLNPDDGMAARVFTSTTVHGFLDQMAVNVIEEYLSAQTNKQEQQSTAPAKW